MVRLERCSYTDAESDRMGRADHLSVFVVDAEGDGRGVQEQPRLLLVHLLPQTLDATLTLRRFLQNTNKKNRRVESDLVLELTLNGSGMLILI